MFSNTLKKLRTDKGLTQSELAQHLSVTQQAVGRWEKSQTSPDYETLKKIASFFNVTTDYLLGKENTGYYHDPDVAELAEELRTNPGMKVLFDASKHAKQEDLQYAADLLKRLKGDEE